MKVIIAGSRSVGSYQLVKQAVEESGFEITEVFSGKALGTDRLGEIWAGMHNVPVRGFKPDWIKHGKSAGPRRNKEMVDQADALVAVWDGESRGTKDVISQAALKGIPIYVKRTDI